MADEVPILNPNYNEGYPSPFLFHAESLSFTTDNEWWPSVWNSQINEGYPSFAGWPNLTNAKVQTRPFPKILPAVIAGYNEDYPVINEINVTDMKVQTRPFPKILPAVIVGYNENYPVINEMDITDMKVQTKPFPKILPDLENPEKLEGYPSLPEIGILTDFGAFANVTTLKKAKISKTVKFIQDYTFYNTALEKVTIAADCEIFEHSFPPGCEILRYET